MNNELRLFIEFLNHSDQECCDLAFLESSEEWLDSLVGKKGRAFFRIYFRNRASDLCGEWDESGHLATEKSLPFVWLSSEGSPQTVIARNAMEFLSLLPYGENILTGIPEILKAYKQNPKGIIPPDEMYSETAIADSYNYQSSHFPGHENMVAFITRTLGIQLNVSPLGTIRNAVNSFPALDEWIEVNLGS